MNPAGVTHQHTNKHTRVGVHLPVGIRAPEGYVRTHLFPLSANSLLICQNSAAFHTKITAAFSDPKSAPYFFFFFREELQVRDVAVEKIYDLIIPFICLMDFHASPLPAPGPFVFIFIAVSCASRCVQICNRVSPSRGVFFPSLCSVDDATLFANRNQNAAFIPGMRVVPRASGRPCPELAAGFSVS